MQSNFIAQLTQQLQQPLPGQEAQLLMANAKRRLEPADPTKVRQSATLLLLYKKEDSWQFPLIQRPSRNPNDRHSGQMSFPGGKREDDDPTLEATAVREAEEEIGVSATAVEVIGKLTPLYIPVSNFMVHPFVGYVPNVPQFSAQLEEVAEIVTIELKELLDPEKLKRKDIDVPQGFRLKNVPFFDIQFKTIWGATAMMLSEFKEVMKHIEI
ncbi:MAG: CoA pyrophosphatase [Bacteroidota bacterium]